MCVKTLANYIEVTDTLMTVLESYRLRRHKSGPLAERPLFRVNPASLGHILRETPWGSPSELSKKMKSSEWAYANPVPMSSLYRFGQFVLDPGKRALSREDSPLFLNPRAMDVLIFLAQNPNRLVTKEELLDAVWGDAFVEEGNLTQSV